MPPASTCTALIAVHNGESFLAQAIESLLRQTRKPDQILVVDDGSTDSTPEILREFGEGIEVVRQDQQGPSVARNRGIEASRGEFIAFLDADDIAEPQRLEKQIRSLEHNLQAAMVFSSVSFIDEHGEALGEPMRMMNFSQKSFFGRMLVRNRIATASAVMARHSVLLKVNCFDEKQARAEDYDLWLRIAARYPVQYLDEPLVRYRIHPKALTRNRRDQHAGEVRAMKKHSLDFIRDALEDAFDSYFEIEMAFARILFRMDEYDQAERILRDLQEKQFSDAAVHFYLGNIHLIRGEMHEAQGEYRQAVLLDDSFACAYNNLGVALASEGKPDEARQALEMARALRLEYSDPAVNLKILRENGPVQTMRITFNRLRTTLKPQTDLKAGERFL